MKIVVLDVHGLAAGFLGCYGNEWVGTPTLDSLACESVVFDNHIADFPLFSPDSISSARLGRLAPASEDPFELTAACRQRGWDATVVRPAKLCDFSSRLEATTAKWTANKPSLLWVDGPSLAPPWSLPRDLLESYFDDEVEGPPWPAPPQGIHDSLPLKDWQRLHNTYAAVVTYFDAQVERLCDALVEQGWSEDLLFCVTARSGLPLGEHGQIGAGPLLYGEWVHVPLLVRFPQEALAGNRVFALTQPADLAAGLSEHLFQGQARGGGASLMNRLTQNRPHAIAVLPESAAAYVRTPQWALVRRTDAEVQLFQKPEDRWEVNDLRLKDLEKAEELERLLPRALT